MIVTVHNPLTQDLEKTFLAEYMPEASDHLTVKNNNGFATSQAVLVGVMGGERSEIIITDGVTNEDTITIDGTTTFPHNADDPVYKLQYNQIKIYRATAIDGTYNLITTVDVDVDNVDKVTRYNDTSGVSTSYYKIKYYNSETTEESDYSDPIAATGYAVATAGSVIDEVVRRLGDTQYNILGVDEYLDIMNEVNDDLITQAHRPYKFLKKKVLLDTTASTDYIDLDTVVTDFWKFDYVRYTWTVGGVARTYKIDEPLSLEDFGRKYDNTNWLDDDELLDVAIDEAENRLMLGPAPKTTQSDVIEFRYYKKFTRITSITDAVETPNTLIYKYKMMAEYYSAKAETDSKWLNLAKKYEDKYGNEVVKMQRVNRSDTGTPRSFAPRKVPAYRKRFYL